MPRHATKTSFRKGHKQTPETIAKRRATIAKLASEGKWVSQREEVRAKLRGPCPQKGVKGIKNGRYKPIGSKAVTREGYVRIKVPGGKWIFLHRVVAEQTLGRKLIPGRGGENVHHLNGNTQDNRPENLVVLPAKVHLGLERHKRYPKCPVCGYKHPPH